MKERVPSIKKNFLLNTAYQLLILMVPLVTTPYISRVLGANGVGVYSYTYSNVSYFMLLAALGSRTYGQREIAYLQNDKEQRSIVFWEVAILRIITTIITTILYLIYVAIIATADKRVALIQTIYLLATGLDIIWLFQGMEDFTRVVIRNTVVKIFNIILVFAFVKTSKDVEVYTLILAGMTLVANISILPYVRDYIDCVSIKRLSIFRHLPHEILLFLPTIAIQVYTHVDKTMIRVFSVDGVENGYYEQTEKIVRVAISVITSLSTVMTPRIAKTFAQKDEVQLQAYMKKSFRFTWLLAIPVTIGIISVTPNFVPIFFGTGYDRVNILMPLYSLLIIPVAVSSILGIQFLIPTGKEKIYTYAVTCSAVVNICINLLLIPRTFSLGATVATVLAEMIGASFMCVYCCRTKLLSINTIWADSKYYWIAGCIMYVIIAVMTRYLPYGIVNLCIKIICGCIAYVVILIICKDEMIHQCMRTFIRIIKRKAA